MMTRYIYKKTKKSSTSETKVLMALPHQIKEGTTIIDEEISTLLYESVTVTYDFVCVIEEECLNKLIAAYQKLANKEGISVEYEVNDELFIIQPKIMDKNMNVPIAHKTPVIVRYKNKKPIKIKEITVKKTKACIVKDFKENKDWIDYWKRLAATISSNYNYFIAFMTAASQWYLREIGDTTAPVYLLYFSPETGDFYEGGYIESYTQSQYNYYIKPAIENVYACPKSSFFSANEIRTYYNDLYNCLGEN